MAFVAALRVLEDLKTPIWLISAGGTVVWCNDGARGRVGLAGHAPASSISVSWGDQVGAASGASRYTGLITFRTACRMVRLRCHISRTGDVLETGDSVMLVEEAARDGTEAGDGDFDGQTNLIHHLSHELRTPLNAVLGFSEIIAGNMIPSPGLDRYQDYAGEIQTAATYMLDLINTLLDLARMESGHAELREEPCDLVRLITLTVRLLMPRAERAGVMIGVVECDGAPVLEADPVLLRQMLTNLIGNAVKFSSPVHGRVEVSVARDAGGELAVVVRDTGIGMRADEIGTAMRPFHQLGNAGRVADKGTGLGLALTKAAIENHGGRLEISAAPGAGTEARLVFPAFRVRSEPDTGARMRCPDAMIRRLS